MSESNETTKAASAPPKPVTITQFAEATENEQQQIDVSNDALLTTPPRREESSQDAAAFALASDEKQPSSTAKSGTKDTSPAVGTQLEHVYAEAL